MAKPTVIDLTLDDSDDSPSDLENDEGDKFNGQARLRGGRLQASETKNNADVMGCHLCQNSTKTPYL